MYNITIDSFVKGNLIRMQTYISIKCFDLHERVNDLINANQVDDLRKLNQTIEQGMAIWRGHVLKSDGSIISEHDYNKIVLQIGTDTLDTLNGVIDQFTKFVGCDINVGLGMSLKESDLALSYAGVIGRGQIIFYDDEVPKKLQELRDASKRSILTKGLEEKVAMNPDAFEGKQKAVGPAKQLEPQIQETAPATNINEYLEQVDDSQPEIKQAKTIKDFENQFHQHAQNNENVENQEDSEKQARVAALKQQIGSILQQVKQHVPVLEQSKTIDPEVYKTILAMSNAMIALGREVLGNSKPVEPEAAPAEEMEKTSLPSNSGTPHQHLDLPAGSQIDSSSGGTRSSGKVLVSDPDGNKHWVGVRAGQIMGESGHPVSSLRPKTE